MQDSSRSDNDISAGGDKEAIWGVINILTGILAYGSDMLNLLKALIYVHRSGGSYISLPPVIAAGTIT